MTGARIRLIVAATLFFGWIVWLSLAVFDRTKVDPLSRAQLAEATYLIAAEVHDADGKPLAKVKVLKRLGSAGPAEGTEIEVENLPKAVVPGQGFPGAGTYLLPLVGRDGGVYGIAGLPRSPGYEAVSPPPSIYPWTDATQIQLRTLGYGL